MLTHGRLLPTVEGMVTSRQAHRIIELLILEKTFKITFLFMPWLLVV